MDAAKLTLLLLIDQLNKTPAAAQPRGGEISVSGGASKAQYLLRPISSDTQVDPVNGTLYDVGAYTDPIIFYVMTNLSAAENSFIRMVIDGTVYNGAEAAHVGPMYWVISDQSNTLSATATKTPLMGHEALQARSVTIEHGVTSNLNAGESINTYVRYGELQ